MPLHLCVLLVDCIGHVSRSLFNAVCGTFRDIFSKLFHVLTGRMDAPEIPEFVFDPAAQAGHGVRRNADRTLILQPLCKAQHYISSGLGHHPGGAFDLQVAVGRFNDGVAQGMAGILDLIEVVLHTFCTALCHVCAGLFAFFLELHPVAKPCSQDLFAKVRAGKAAGLVQGMAERCAPVSGCCRDRVVKAEQSGQIKEILYLVGSIREPAHDQVSQTVLREPFGQAVPASGQAVISLIVDQAQHQGNGRNHNCTGVSQCFGNRDRTIHQHLTDHLDDGSQRVPDVRCRIDDGRAQRPCKQAQHPQDRRTNGQFLHCRAKLLERCCQHVHGLAQQWELLNQRSACQQPYKSDHDSIQRCDHAFRRCKVEQGHRACHRKDRFGNGHQGIRGPFGVRCPTVQHIQAARHCYHCIEQDQQRCNSVFNAKLVIQGNCPGKYRQRGCHDEHALCCICAAAAPLPVQQAASAKQHQLQRQQNAQGIADTTHVVDCFRQHPHSGCHCIQCSRHQDHGRTGPQTHLCSRSDHTHFAHQDRYNAERIV